jgi:hypothetical protein
MSRHGNREDNAPKEKVESPPTPSEQEQVPQGEGGLTPPEGPTPKKKKRKKRK